jgi:uncharacterized membrane protein YfcA
VDDWIVWLLLFASGAIAGALNVVAGGGSFLTLPILIFTGLPAGVANGTNRVGILLQNMAGVWGFRRYGLIERRWLVAAALPTMLGGVLGTLLALRVADDAFKRILAFLMIAVTLWTLWDPIRPSTGRPGGASPTHAWFLAAGFFVAGIYAGFVQAGVGFFLLAITTLAGYDLVRGNAMKIFCVLVSTPLSLALFAADGQVAWVPGLFLGIGNALGGLVGVHLTVLKGHRWIRGVVTVTVIVMAVKLWFD